MNIEFYKDASGEYRWRIRSAGNNKIMGDSSEGYTRVEDAVRAWKEIEKHVWDGMNMVFLDS